ncbi:chloramphenicol O-acetyltransferase type A [Microbacterium halimionae]|uniref:Chloramphenicol O-acetyltransferase type A n=1 Tax=Microbacterium halimionae TaxID=1526413 RepID=A0A7W3JQ75_9MICO|nr:type A chloramphenicol O-acetyltransferase [Microbacterium halimionae]MBA8816946.1 chloramphenicol O-acetyltransferase type A [Microbacterium halimionae]NII94515.1 chloramphenicol O-acetyltransferase type A [Microbacterium halimionae]
MNDPIPIDVETWPRRQHFEHYRTAVPCTYSITVELDVTTFVAAVRSAMRRTYIAQIWAIASVVNRYEEFRMTLTDSGAPATWSLVHPSFTVFNRERETFASVWAPYNPDFAAFHEAAAHVIAEHAESTRLFPQGPSPRNSFDVSSLPWTAFTGFTLNIGGSWDHLAPIFTLGQYVERDGQVLLPLAVQMHHAAADGFHTARLINELRDLFSDASWVSS